MTIVYTMDLRRHKNSIWK